MELSKIVLARHILLNLVAGNGCQCIYDIMDTKTYSSEQYNDAKYEISQKIKFASSAVRGTR
jgi:hypothetical protein